MRIACGQSAHLKALKQTSIWHTLCRWRKWQLSSVILALWLSC